MKCTGNGSRATPATKVTNAPTTWPTGAWSHCSDEREIQFAWARARGTLIVYGQIPCSLPDRLCPSGSGQRRTDPGRAQIGRASCRGRVEVVGVAVGTEQ